MKGAILFVLLAACTTQDDTVDWTGTSVEALQQNQNLLVPGGVPIPDGTGFGTTVSSTGSIDFSNDFFQNLGTNGRRCVTCHLPTAGWGITPPQVQLVFALTNGGTIDDGLGLGAIFRTNDGSVSPNADTSTQAARKNAFAMLLTKGLIRVGIGMPANAEFDLIAVDDPYNFASANQLSLFRRPLPATNLKVLSTVMWDGRENASGQTIHFDLGNQATDATQGHAQGAPLTPDEETAIVNLESSTYFAQTFDVAAGSLNAAGANGGPTFIENMPFHIGINDNFGDCIDPACMVIGAPLGTGQRGAPFNPDVFTIYDAWANTNSGTRTQSADRRAVARGQELFNNFPITITGVGGLNDNPAFGSPASLTGGCVTCHNVPNSGNHSVAAPLNIGIASAGLRTPDMPLYTFRNKTTGETVQVTDPGRALITGKWANMAEFKGPVLRGLAARAPYFHNGMAADLDAVVDFYNTRFNMGLTAQQHSDLVAFLQTL